MPIAVVREQRSLGAEKCEKPDSRNSDQWTCSGEGRREKENSFEMPKDTKGGKSPKLHHIPYTLQLMHVPQRMLDDCQIV